MRLKVSAQARKEVEDTFDELKKEFLEIVDAFGPAIEIYETALKRIAREDLTVAEIKKIAHDALRRVP